MKTTKDKRETVKIYCIEVKGSKNALLVKRNAERPGAYELTLSLEYAINKGAYYKTKKGLMYEDGQYLSAYGTKYRIRCFKVIKPIYYDIKDL